MNTGVRLYDIANLSHLQAKSAILERFLHLPPLEKSKIAPALRAVVTKIKIKLPVAIALPLSESFERFLRV